MCHFNAAKGFTLIELLVVLTISMTAFALVGGLTVDFNRKYQVNAEILTLKALLRKASQTAFAAEKRLSVTLDQSVMSLLENKRVLTRHQFEYLTFQNQTMYINQFGLATVKEITYRVGDTRYALDASDIYAQQ